MIGKGRKSLSLKILLGLFLILLKNPLSLKKVSDSRPGDLPVYLALDRAVDQLLAPVVDRQEALAVAVVPFDRSVLIADDAVGRQAPPGFCVDHPAAGPFIFVLPAGLAEEFSPGDVLVDFALHGCEGLRVFSLLLLHCSHVLLSKSIL